MSRVMTSPDFSTDIHFNLVRRMIEARTAYEQLCGAPPTCIHVRPWLLEALANRGFGTEVAGMKIIWRHDPAVDDAICSRDEDLFKPPVVTLPLLPSMVAKPRRKVKSR